MRTLPTIKAAKGYCKARYGRLPRAGHEMKVMEYVAPCRAHNGASARPCILQFAHDDRHEIYLVNESGSYKVREYVTFA